MQDVNRIRYLVDTARDHCVPPTDKTLATLLGVTFQKVSNWRNGQKAPPVETQCELAQIGQVDVPATALMSMIEAAEGERKKRLQSALTTMLKKAGKSVVMPLGIDTSAKDTKMLRQIKSQEEHKAQNETWQEKMRTG